MSRQVLAGASIVAYVCVVLASACTSTNSVPIGVDCEDGFCDGGGAFGPSLLDGGDAETPSEIAMCPVTTCTAPWTTCPSSKSPCDVDLTRDYLNCGACGVVCDSMWSCIGGRCVFGCIDSHLDCDGDPSNGCETDVQADSSNCGDCGRECPFGFVCARGKCITQCQARGLPDECEGECTTFSTSDAHCGGCDNPCDPTGQGGQPLPFDMYYGCVGGTCDRPKCRFPKRADCNGDLSDGCEATLGTNEHCAHCGDACAPGKQCGQTADGFGPYACLCEDDTETLCGHQCVQTADDPENCGGCGVECPGLFSPHFEATCKQGLCGGTCEVGYADCNELASDGCEIDTRVDNRHCGACGHACLPDQVCSDGKCLVAPCDPNTPTR